MKGIVPKRWVTCGLLAALLGASGVAQSSEQSKEQSSDLSSQDLVYTHDEMFNFDIDAYLAKNSPHLRRHAESISHWAGYSGVSPKVLIALMEMQSGVVSGEGAAPDAILRPFGAMASSKDFNAQTRDVALALSEAMYETRESAGATGPAPLASTNPLQPLLVKAGKSRAEAARGGGRFQFYYDRLFHEGRRISASSLPPPAGPENGFLQFPFPRGELWAVGGAHTNTGSGNFPMSSLDMSVGGGWGSDQDNVWVVASADGRFKLHSSCFAEVVHSGGWSTTYYHLTNIRHDTGAIMSTNARIGNPANEIQQALCSGGHPTGPHQHWSLKSNGSHYHLNGVYLSGFRITATGGSYDINCKRFHLSKAGHRYCVGRFLNP